MYMRTLAVVAGLAVAATSLVAQESILVQSTTSTEASGLYGHLLPIFEEETGITVNVVAVGTGQAIQNARNCDADVLLVHAKAREEQFVADGAGVERFDLMYNDFVVVGPESDPAGVAGMTDAPAAFAQIAAAEAPFASRGDDSGTHTKELQIWEAAGIDVDAASALWQGLLEAGAPLGLVPAGLAARDTLRLEAGMPLYGNELSLSTRPAQVGAGRVVVLGKEGGFVGETAVAAPLPDDAPVLVGLVAEGRRAGRSGYAVFASETDADPVGTVTSGQPSPTLGYPVALAAVDPALAEIGTRLFVDLRGKAESFEVVALPFYRREA